MFSCECTRKIKRVSYIDGKNGTVLKVSSRSVDITARTPTCFYFSA